MKRLALMLLCGILFGCGTIRMNIKTYYDPDIFINPKPKYCLVPVDKENPLLEKEILAMIRKKFDSMGMKEDREKPDYYVFAVYDSKSFQYNKPISTLYIPQYKPSETTTTYGHVGRTPVYGASTTQGTWENKPFTYGGGTETAFTRGMNIVFLDAKNAGNSEKLETVWRGQALSAGQTEDIRLIAPFLIDEIMNSYPFSTSRSTDRLPYSRPSWLGKYDIPGDEDIER